MNKVYKLADSWQTNVCVCVCVCVRLTAAVTSTLFSIAISAWSILSITERRSSRATVTMVTDRVLTGFIRCWLLCEVNDTAIARELLGLQRERERVSG